jgi:plasmid stabilization system protein ParE
MKVVWSRRAIVHLTALRAHLEKGSEQHAARTAARIVARELVVPNTPYILPYRVRGDRLELMAVFSRSAEMVR